MFWSGWHVASLMPKLPFLDLIFYVDVLVFPIVQRLGNISAVKLHHADRSV